jgi:hypothetical protein
VPAERFNVPPIANVVVRDEYDGSWQQPGFGRIYCSRSGAQIEISVDKSFSDHDGASLCMAGGGHGDKRRYD